MNGLDGREARKVRSVKAQIFLAFHSRRPHAERPSEINGERPEAADRSGIEMAESGQVRSSVTKPCA